MIGAIASPPLTRGVSMTDSTYQRTSVRPGPTKFFQSPPRRAWKTRGKRRLALNKGMPIYDQMSGWRVDSDSDPRKTGIFRPSDPGEGDT